MKHFLLTDTSWKKTPNLYIQFPNSFNLAIAKVNEYNSLQLKKENNQGFAKFAQLKKLCDGNEVALDDLLLNQEVVYPEALNAQSGC